jgi:hypothetical protein
MHEYEKTCIVELFFPYLPSEVDSKLRTLHVCRTKLPQHIVFCYFLLETLQHSFHLFFFYHNMVST